MEEDDDAENIIRAPRLSIPNGWCYASDGSLTRIVSARTAKTRPSYKKGSLAVTAEEAEVEEAAERAKQKKKQPETLSKEDRIRLERRQKISSNTWGELIYGVFMTLLAVGISTLILVGYYGWLQIQVRTHSTFTNLTHWWGTISRALHAQMATGDETNPFSGWAEGYSLVMGWGNKQVYHENSTKGAMLHSNLCFTFGIVLVTASLTERLIPDDTVPLVWLLVCWPLKLMGMLGCVLVLCGCCFLYLEEGKEFATG